MCQEKPRLGRDVFIALAAVGWADGRLDAVEADAIVRTALEEGLELKEIAQIEEATRERVDIGEIDRRRLSKEDRLFVYAVASWMARLDGEETEPEAEALRRLGDALKIPEPPRRHADAIAREIAALPEGDCPDRYDLPRLRQVIAERLRAAQRARAEAEALERSPGESPEAVGKTPSAPRRGRGGGPRSC